MREITAKEAKEMVDGRTAVIIDVRTPTEFSEGRIAGAININLFDSEFTEKIKMLEANMQYLVYCHGGGRSAQACLLMCNLGNGNGINLAGGILAWEREGLPTER